MNFKKIILFLAFIVGSEQLMAQLVQPVRLEFELEDTEEYFSVISAKELGVILHRKNEEKSKGEFDVYDIYLYDTTLVEVRSVELKVKDLAEYTGYEYKDGYLYMLFRETNNKADDYYIFAVDLLSGIIKDYKISNAIPIQLTEFTTVDGVMLLGGYVNFRPTILYYDLNEKKYRVVPGFYLDNSELLEIKVNDEANTFTVLYSEETRQRIQTIGMKTFSREGELLLEFKLKPQDDRNLLYGRTTSFGDDAMHIAGTYSNKKSKYSRGIFIANIYPDGKQEINYYNYGELENFFSYMSPKREAKIKRKIERRKGKGKNLKFSYRLLVHDVVEKDGSNILLCEAFYPKYSNRPAGNFITGFGRNSFSNYDNNNYLEGYKYTHAVVIGFDDKGNLVWDNSFEINDILSLDLQKYVHLLPMDDKLILLYVFENVVHTKVIRGNEVLTDKASEDVSTLFEADEVKNNNYDIGGLQDWYDDNFFVFGIQRIKNTHDGDVKLNRKVFFINKLRYAPKNPISEPQSKIE